MNENVNENRNENRNETGKEKRKQWRRPALFTLGGALAGLAYYVFVGCESGSCAITASPVSSMLYMALLGYLLSGAWGKECEGGCSM